MSKKGRLLILSGPSGVGKGTIVQKLLEHSQQIVLSVSATTRSPREGEQDGVHYYFITQQEFERKIQAGEMLEYAVYNGNYYGTPRDKVEEATSQGKDVILEIEVQGARKVMEKAENCVSIFILPPSWEELERRLTERKTEDADTIRKRLERAKEELAFAEQYEYRIVNQDLDKAVEEVEDILQSVKSAKAKAEPALK